MSSGPVSVAVESLDCVTDEMRTQILSATMQCIKIIGDDDDDSSQSSRRINHETSQEAIP